MMTLLVVGIIGIGSSIVSSFTTQCSFSTGCLIPLWMGLGILTIVISLLIFFSAILIVSPAKRRAEKNGIVFPPLRSWVTPSIAILVVEIILVVFILPQLLS